MTIPPITSTPLDSIQVNLPPESSTATISQYYPQLNQSWEIGSQTVDTSSNILSRLYSISSFPYTSSKLLLVPTSDPQWAAPFYYLLLSNFLESAYSASGDFTTWTQIDTKFSIQGQYQHSPLSTLVWNRPTTEVAGTDEGTPTILYQDLPTPFTLTTAVGSALGATIQVTPSATPFTVSLLPSPTGTPTPVSSLNPIVLYEPYLQITFPTPTNEATADDLITPSPTQVTITFYGAYKYSVYTPSTIGGDSSPITLTHPYGTPLATRLKPPGLSSLPDNFWNTNYASIPTITQTTNSPSFL